MAVLLAGGWPTAGRAQRPGTTAAPPAVVFDGVTVVDVEQGRVLADQRVVVMGTRIRAVGAVGRVAIPPGARIVAARGKYLIPGLWDMHVHPALGAAVPGVDERTRHAVNAVYHQLLANGVTGMRDAGSSIPLDTFRVWKQEIAAGRRAGPRLIVSGQAIDQVGGTFGDATGLEPRGDVIRCWRSAVPANVPKENCQVFANHINAFGPADARHLVDSLQAAGADMIKTYDLSPAMYFAIAAEARRVGIPFGGHVGGGGEPQSDFNGLIASDSGARILDHGLWTYDVCGSSLDTVLSLPRCVAAAARLRRNHTWVATWDVGGPAWPSADSAFRRRAMRYAGTDYLAADVDDWRPLTAAERRQLPSGADFAATLPDSAIRGRGCQKALLAYAANLPFMPGEDWPLFTGAPGSGVHEALRDAVLCGVPPLWALQTATLNPVRALNATDSLGTVTVGKVADLVLLEGNPLADIWNVSKIAGVVANGRYFDRAALDRLLVDAATEWRQVKAIRIRRQAQEQEQEKKAAATQTP